MTRLRSLIKEVLSQPKKKDCNCGCNDCGGKAPILTEGKVKHLISEGLQYHMDKKIQLHESVYRIGSEKHFELIREARALWVRGIIDVSEDDQAILETNLGHFGMYEGEAVPLDMPMLNENQDYDIVSTKNLDAYIYKDGGIKLRIYSVNKSPYGYTSRDLISSLFGVKDEEFTYDYIKKEIDKKFTKFPEEEIKEKTYASTKCRICVKCKYIWIRRLC